MLVDLVSFSFKAIGYGLGAIFGLGGVFLLTVGTSTNNQSSVSAGWSLVALAFLMWFISLISRRVR